MNHLLSDVNNNLTSKLNSSSGWLYLNNQNLKEYFTPLGNDSGIYSIANVSGGAPEENMNYFMLIKSYERMLVISSKGSGYYLSSDNGKWASDWEKIF